MLFRLLSMPPPPSSHPSTSPPFLLIHHHHHHPHPRTATPCLTMSQHTSWDCSRPEFIGSAQGSQSNGDCCFSESVSLPKGGVQLRGAQTFPRRGPLNCLRHLAGDPFRNPTDNGAKFVFEKNKKKQKVNNKRSFSLLVFAIQDLLNAERHCHFSVWF